MQDVRNEQGGQTQFMGKLSVTVCQSQSHRSLVTTQQYEIAVKMNPQMNVGATWGRTAQRKIPQSGPLLVPDHGFLVVLNTLKGKGAGKGSVLLSLSCQAQLKFRSLDVLINLFFLNSSRVSKNIAYISTKDMLQTHQCVGEQQVLLSV